ATRYGRSMIGEEGGTEGVDQEWLARGDVGIGATIMGRNMFGPIRGPWGDAGEGGPDEWRGWWGPEPPYHHPVFVLTHQAGAHRALEDERIGDAGEVPAILIRSSDQASTVIWAKGPPAYRSRFGPIRAAP